MRQTRRSSSGFGDFRSGLHTACFVRTHLWAWLSTAAAPLAVSFWATMAMTQAEESQLKPHPRRAFEPLTSARQRPETQKEKPGVPWSIVVSLAPRMAPRAANAMAAWLLVATVVN
jgi:hypothetical protein